MRGWIRRHLVAAPVGELRHSRLPKNPRKAALNTPDGLCVTLSMRAPEDLNVGYCLAHLVLMLPLQSIPLFLFLVLEGFASPRGPTLIFLSLPSGSALCLAGLVFPQPLALLTPQGALVPFIASGKLSRYLQGGLQVHR